MKSIAQIRSEATKTSALIEFYNAHSGKQIKKFSTRGAGVEQCVKLAIQIGLPEFDEEEMDELTEEQKAAVAAETAAATAEIEAEKEAEAENDRVNGSAIWAALLGGVTEEQKAVLAKGKDTSTKVVDGKVVNEEEEEEKPVVHSGRASNAAGVAASWARPDVAAARLTRHGVAVEVTDDPEYNPESTENQREFKSTNDAFRALRLPVQKHIRFRMALKAAGRNTFEMDGKYYHFILREITKPEAVAKDGE